MVGCCFKGALHYFLDILVILHLIQHSDYNMSTHAQNANTHTYMMNLHHKNMRKWCCKENNWIASITRHKQLGSFCNEQRAVNVF